MELNFELRKADSKEWGVFYSVYYNLEENGFFKERLYDIYFGDFAFWIFRDGKKIGGVVIENNRLSNLFVIPPFQDMFAVVKFLKNILWDGGARHVSASVHPDQEAVFARAGFWSGEVRSLFMQRPTEHFDIEWSHDVKVVMPEIEKHGERERLVNEMPIAEIFHKSFAGGINAVRRQNTSPEHYIFAKYPNISNEVIRNASCLVYDSKTNELVGACLLSIGECSPKIPDVFYICVRPDYIGRGIGTNMLKRALSMLKGHYPILRISLMQGTDAESVYYNLGFQPARAFTEHFYIPKGALVRK